MDNNKSVERGDLWVAMPDDGTPRVVLVVDDVDGRHVEVALVHSAPELSTAPDMICDPESVTVRWPVVVQGDLRGVSQVSRLLRRVGRVALPLTGRRGFPLGGPTTDRRWQFKQDEGRALSALTLGLADVDGLVDCDSR